VLIRLITRLYDAQSQIPNTI